VPLHRPPAAAHGARQLEVLSRPVHRGRHDWFDILWFKHLSIPDAATRQGVRQTVSHEFWQRLYAGDRSVEQELAGLDLESLTFRAMAGAA